MGKPLSATALANLRAKLAQNSIQIRGAKTRMDKAGRDTTAYSDAAVTLARLNRERQGILRQLG